VKAQGHQIRSRDSPSHRRRPRACCPCR
jgi:hypothetical protein